MALLEQIERKESEITVKRAEWKKAADAIDAAGEMPTAEQIEALRTGNKELAQLVEERKSLTELANETQALKADMEGLDSVQKDALERARELHRKQDSEPEAESWGVKAYRSLKQRAHTKELPFVVEKSLKALFNEGPFTAATGNVPGYYVPASNEGYPPELRRDPALFTPDAVRPVQFWNTIQQISTMRPTDVYMRETVNADSSNILVGEGGAYVEDDGFDYNEASNPIKDVGTYYAVTRDIVEDEPMMVQILEMRMMERMSRKLDNIFLNQTSGANNILGLLQYSDHPTFVKSADDSLQVAITKAIEAVNGPAVTGITNSGGQAMADAIYVTVPIYWEFMRQQDALGNFMVSMGLREAPQLRVAGVPVMQCQALPAGNILVMDRSFTHIRDRRAVDVYWMEQLGVSSNNTVPTARRMVVADARATITIRRPAANCSVTGA